MRRIMDPAKILLRLNADLTGSSMGVPGWSGGWKRTRGVLSPPPTTLISKLFLVTCDYLSIKDRICGKNCL